MSIVCVLSASLAFRDKKIQLGPNAWVEKNTSCVKKVEAHCIKCQIKAKFIRNRQSRGDSLGKKEIRLEVV